MSLKISTLGKERADLTIAFTGTEDVLNIVYNPKAYTIELEEQLEARDASQFKGKSLAIMLLGGIDPDTGKGISPMLLEWDLVDDEENVIPIDYDHLKVLPVEVLGTVISKIAEASKPTSEEGKA